HAIFNPSYGLLGGLLTTVFGENAPQPDLMSSAPLVGIGLVLVWQWTPFMMLIMLAGLQSRPMDVYEAALVDGAGHWQTFRFITLPRLRRYSELAALLGTIYIVQNFDMVFTMTSGGLGTATLPYVIYQEFFVAQDYGASSAVGVIVVAASLIIATFALRTASTLLKEENSCAPQAFRPPAAVPRARPRTPPSTNRTARDRQSRLGGSRERRGGPDRDAPAKSFSGCWPGSSGWCS